MYIYVYIYELWSEAGERRLEAWRDEYRKDAISGVSLCFRCSSLWDGKGRGRGGLNSGGGWDAGGGAESGGGGQGEEQEGEGGFLEAILSKLSVIRPILVSCALFFVCSPSDC